MADDAAVGSATETDHFRFFLKRFDEVFAADIRNLLVIFCYDNFGLLVDGGCEIFAGEGVFEQEGDGKPGVCFFGRDENAVEWGGQEELVPLSFGGSVDGHAGTEAASHDVDGFVLGLDGIKQSECISIKRILRRMPLTVGKSPVSDEVEGMVWQGFG